MFAPRHLTPARAPIDAADGVVSGGRVDHDTSDR
jgi:hypothetical protein